MELLNGVLFHATGASSAALCYTPKKKWLAGAGKPTGWRRHLFAGWRCRLSWRL